MFLQLGEEIRVTVAIDSNAFSRYDESGDRREIKGTHTIYAGFCQPDSRSVSLTGGSPLKAEIAIGYTNLK